MNKYLLMCAAAALTTTADGGVARASTTLHIDNGSSDYCDYFIVTKNAGGLWAGKHVGTRSCGTSAFDDPAYLGGRSTSPFGVKTKSVGFADPIWAVEGLPYGLEFVFSYPFNPDNGGQWLSLANTSGNTTFILNYGRTSSKIRPGKHESSVAHALAAFRVGK